MIERLVGVGGLSPEDADRIAEEVKNGLKIPALNHPKPFTVKTNSSSLEAKTGH